MLVDAAGTSTARSAHYPDGREALALTFAQAVPRPYLQLAYGLVSWATRGLFVGERHAYAVPQIDDFFLASSIYTGGTYRINAADLQALADWQNAMRAQPLTAGLAAGLGGERAGIAIDARRSADRQGGGARAGVLLDQPQLGSPDPDGLSYADVLTEFTRNDTYLRGLGLSPYAPPTW